MSAVFPDDVATAWLETPVGRLDLVAGSEGLCRVLFPVDKKDTRPAIAPSIAARTHVAAAKKAFLEYFAGHRKNFDDIPLVLSGTDFQQSVWRALKNITYGTTCTYRDIAVEIGNEKAVRAVGLANGRNPLPVILPCHRVIGSDGSLTGFGGGLFAKKWLLEHEGALTAEFVLEQTGSGRSMKPGAALLREDRVS